MLASKKMTYLLSNGKEIYLDIYDKGKKPRVKCKIVQGSKERGGL